MTISPRAVGLLAALLGLTSCAEESTLGPPGTRCEEVASLSGRVPNDNQCEFIDHRRDSVAWETANAWLNAVTTAEGAAGTVEVDYLRLMACVNGASAILWENSYQSGDEIEGDTYLLGRPPQWFADPSPGLVELFGTHVESTVPGATGVLVIQPADKPDRIFHLWNSEESGLSHGNTTTVWVEARVRVTGGAMVQVGYDFRRERHGIPVQGGQSGWLRASDWQIVVVPSNGGCP